MTAAGDRRHHDRHPGGPPPAFVCPVCETPSWNVHDRTNGYCGRCHAYTQTEVGRLVAAVVNPQLPPRRDP